MDIKKTNYEVEIDSKGSITSLKSNGKQFIKTVLPLLQFKLSNCENGKIYSLYDAENTEVQKSGDDVFVTSYFNSINVIFKIKMHFDKRIEASFEFENNSGEYIEWVDFPQIAVPNDLAKAGGSGKLIIDTNEGLLIDDISAKQSFYPYSYRDMKYPSEGLYSMFPAVVQSQFLSYYDDNAGIYFLAEDAKRTVKGIDFKPLEDAIKLQFRLYPGILNT